LKGWSSFFHNGDYAQVSYTSKQDMTLSESGMQHMPIKILFPLKHHPSIY